MGESGSETGLEGRASGTQPWTGYGRRAINSPPSRSLKRGYLSKTDWVESRSSPIEGRGCEGVCAALGTTFAQDLWTLF